MNIYFSCSITGGRQDEDTYQAIVEALLADGHEVPTAHLAFPEVMDLERVVDPVEVYTRDLDWIKACQAVVAEVTTPSHGVGYEIAFGLELGKPVLCCYRQGTRISKMISGNTHPLLETMTYQSTREAVAGVRRYLAQLPR